MPCCRSLAADRIVELCRAIARGLAVLSGFAAMVLVSDAPARAESAANQLSTIEQRSGWTLLFDGQSTQGWRNYRADSISDGWEVRDGVLLRARQGAKDIVTKKQYEFFELSLDYRISKGGNSGLMFHVTEDGAAPWHSGPEVQIQDNGDGHDPQRAGWLYQLYKPARPLWQRQVEEQAGVAGREVDDATRPAGEWNQLYLRIAPQQCEVAINGVSYYYFQLGSDEWNDRVAHSKFAKFAQFGKAGKGHICLQDHGNEVAFRNIKIRELPADGSVPEPIDGTLALKGVPAFPKLQLEGWSAEDDRGRTKPFRAIEITHAGDGTGRIFVGSQIGTVHVFQPSPDVTESKLFLDLRDRVHDWKLDNEEGLLGLAFHPKFRENGQFFVCYSSEPKLRHSIISRFRVSPNDPNRADPKEEVILEIPQPFANHNGGAIAFGPDGYLYLGLGDGGSRNDPFGNGQNLGTWMGSILRIDVDHPADGKPYGIPADNPFVKRAGAQPEIYAYGFRNVWRLAFDRQTGHLWVGDVGQDLWEEIDIVKRGGNYGWSVREGNHPFGNSSQPPADPTIDPVWEYDHRVGKSITGGVVSRGSRLPELHGAYLYADYVAGRIYALYYDEQAGQVVKNLGIPSTNIPVLAFGQDEAGEVYYSIESLGAQGIMRFERSE